MMRLKRIRSGNVYKHYSTYRQILESDQIRPKARDWIRSTIEGMKAPGAEFAGMIRYFDALFSPSER